MKYYYVAWSDRIITRYSTIYINTPLEFKKGYIIYSSTFNCFEDNKDYAESIHACDLVKVYKNLTFTNKHLAYVTYLKLKIDEMNNNGCSIFFPNCFNNLKRQFDKIYLEKPELLI